MPDFDIDFCYERRNEVIQYVTEKYGADHVSQVITFGTLAARAAIRNVARALDVPYADADRIAKMVPTELNITLDQALAINPELRRYYDNDEVTRRVIDLSAPGGYAAPCLDSCRGCSYYRSSRSRSWHLWPAMKIRSWSSSPRTISRK